MTPPGCCGHEVVSHALTVAGVRAGRCSEPRCGCGVVLPPVPLPVVLIRLVARAASRLRFRRPAVTPAVTRHRTAPLVASPASDVELDRLFRAAEHHALQPRNRVPAAAYRMVRQRNTSPRH